MPPPASLLNGEAEPIGCACYRIYIRNRTTKALIDGCDFLETAVSGTFGFSLINTTGFDIEIPVQPGCCDCYPKKWRDEIVVERYTADGKREGELWCGTVTQVVEDSIAGTLKIVTKDPSIWWGRNPVSARNVLEPIDEAELWRQLVGDSEAKNPSGVTLKPFRPTGVEFTEGVTRRSTVTTESTTTETRADGSKIVTETTVTGSSSTDASSLILGGLESVFWTIHGCELYGPGPTTVDQSPYATLDVEKHWTVAGGVFDDDGAFVTTQATVIGKDVRGDEIVGRYPATSVPHPDYGVHESEPVIDLTLSTQAQVDAAAREIYERDKDGSLFFVTSSSSLSKDAPVTPWDLVPGRLFWVVSRSTCNQVRVLRQLNNVKIEVGAKRTSLGRRTGELRVAVDFGPPGVIRSSSERVSI